MLDESLAEAAIADASEKDLREYGAVSRLSVAALGLGAISFLALFSPPLLIIPVLAAFAAWRALVGIRESHMALVGRKAALAGLALSIMFATAVPAEYAATRWWLTKEADAFARQWFDYLRQAEPIKAHQLSISPELRRSLKNREQLLEYYRVQDARDDIKYFLADPLIRVLLRLGDKAQVRLYANEGFAVRLLRYTVTNLYAVSYPDDTKKKTFFLRLGLEKSRSVVDGWQITTYDGGVRPLEVKP